MRKMMRGQNHSPPQRPIGPGLCPRVFGVGSSREAKSLRLLQSLSEEKTVLGFEALDLQNSGSFGKSVARVMQVLSL